METICIGTPIVHYHALTGFDAPCLRKLFTRLTSEEVFALKCGDTVYVDVGSLRRGRHSVYGWIKATVTDTRYVGERWKISYQTGPRRPYKGCVRVERDGFCPDLSRPDESLVTELVRTHPDALHI